MKCHYEVLNVHREAQESEIKSAYKKLALRWHPDKNLNNPTEAKEQFQLVQQAYEVLCDRQERAWYDNHREQILKGSNKNYEDNCLNVFPYFTTACYSGFGDDNGGFYAVYSKVFESIAKEEMEYIQKEEFCEIPMFGNSQSNYETTVTAFYNFWLGYSTKRSYVWVDTYQMTEDMRERRLLKLIDKENRKVRSKAKKERNEEVRNLVAFVRKRDKRVQAYSKLLEARATENKLKQENMVKQRRLARLKEIEETPIGDWMKFENVQSELSKIEISMAQEFGEELSDISEDDDDGDYDDLYCLVCSKIFKTAKSLENHESSKKHKEKFKFLKETMLREEREIFKNGRSEEETEEIGTEVEEEETEEIRTEVEEEETEEIGTEVEEEETEEIRTEVEEEETEEIGTDVEEETEEIGTEVEEEEEVEECKKKKKRRNKKVLLVNHDVEESGVCWNLGVDDTAKADDKDFSVGKIKKKGKKQKEKQTKASQKQQEVEKTKTKGKKKKQ